EGIEPGCQRQGAAETIVVGRSAILQVVERGGEPPRGSQFRGEDAHRSGGRAGTPCTLVRNPEPARSAWPILPEDLLEVPRKHCVLVVRQSAVEGSHCGGEVARYIAAEEQCIDLGAPRECRRKR